jgi:hypothetical protein
MKTVKTTRSIDPLIWGKLVWATLFWLTVVWTKQPYVNQNNYVAWCKMIRLLPFVLPCQSCRKHCARFIHKFPPEDSVQLQSRTWLYTLWSRIRAKFAGKSKNRQEAAARGINRDVPYNEWLAMHDVSIYERYQTLLKTVCVRFMKQAAAGNQSKQRYQWLQQWSTLVCASLQPHTQKDNALVDELFSLSFSK